MAQVKRRPMPREMKRGATFAHLQPVVITTDYPINYTFYTRGIGWMMGKQFFPIKGITGLYLTEFGGDLGNDFAVVTIDIEDNQTADVVIHKNNLSAQ